MVGTSPRNGWSIKATRCNNIGYEFVCRVTLPHYWCTGIVVGGCIRGELMMVGQDRTRVRSCIFGICDCNCNGRLKDMLSSLRDYLCE